MSALEMARRVKGGEITRTNAVKEFRLIHMVDFMTALLAIDIAIGDINEGIHEGIA
jgi:hypothetical protein